MEIKRAGTGIVVSVVVGVVVFVNIEVGVFVGVMVGVFVNVAVGVFVGDEVDVFVGVGVGNNSSGPRAVTGSGSVYRRMRRLSHQPRDWAGAKPMYPL